MARKKTDWAAVVKKRKETMEAKRKAAQSNALQIKVVINENDDDDPTYTVYSKTIAEALTVAMNDFATRFPNLKMRTIEARIEGGEVTDDDDDPLGSYNNPIVLVA